MDRPAWMLALAESAPKSMQLVSRLSSGKKSSPPTRPTTTTSATPTSRTSSTSGCAARCGSIFPDLFATLAVPKAEELVATPYRHEQGKGRDFFPRRHDGRDAPPRRASAPRLPVTIYYAFKQSETKGDGHWQHRLGDLSRRSDSCRLLRHRHLADADRKQRKIGDLAPTPSPPASSSSAASALPTHQWPPAANSSPR